MVSNERVFGVETYDVIDLAERKLFNFVDIGRERKKKGACARRSFMGPHLWPSVILYQIGKSCVLRTRVLSSTAN